MKKLTCLMLALGLTAALTLPAMATDDAAGDAAAEDLPSPIQNSVIINDEPLPQDVPFRIVDGVSYVSYVHVVQALYPDATAQWVDDRAIATAQGLDLQFPICQNYMIANGRYLYLPQGYLLENALILVPARPLCAALGASVSWDPVGGNVVITAGEAGPIASGEDTYNADDLYWLSRIIYAESGNQSLEGKIAVGNVVLNRAASSDFPNTVEEVIFQKNQFSPAASGSIYREPNAESVIAAKLCLDGANTAGNALWFHNPKIVRSCWATRHGTYITTIGAHAFYG